MTRVAAPKKSGFLIHSYIRMSQERLLTLDEYIIQSADPLTFSAPLPQIQKIRERWTGVNEHAGISTEPEAIPQYRFLHT